MVLDLVKFELTGDLSVPGSCTFGWYTFKNGLRHRFTITRRQDDYVFHSDYYTYNPALSMSGEIPEGPYPSLAAHRLAIVDAYTLWLLMDHVEFAVGT